MSDDSATPAGWYSDPQTPAHTRYWDGAAWTHHVAIPTAPPYAAAQPLNQPQKKGLGTGAIIAIAVSVGLVVVIGIMAAIAIPLFTSQRAKAIDAAAKSDAASLGLEIASYYVDHNGTAPQIIVVDGMYVFEDGTPTMRDPSVSPKVQLGGQTSASWEDWCVWVTGNGGDLKDFEYSSADGLKQGRCGQ